MRNIDYNNRDLYVFEVLEITDFINCDEESYIEGNTNVSKYCLI